MIPVPYACNPGDTLRVIAEHPYGTPLTVGDLVTVHDTGVHPGPPPMPVVIIVHPTLGRRVLGFDALEPYTSPDYAPAENDDVIDAILSKMIEVDSSLGEVFATINADLATLDAAEEQLSGGAVATAEVEEERPIKRAVGVPYSFTDNEDDELEVTYFEQTCGNHGREGGFLFLINNDANVLIPVTEIDGLIRFLYQMKKHSQRPE